jgi:hypothetical protein
MLSGEAPNCPCITGIATLTMLVSRTDMNIPTTTTASGSTQLVEVGAGGGGAGVVGLLGPLGGVAGVRGAVSTAVDPAPDAVPLCPFLESVT